MSFNLCVTLYPNPSRRDEFIKVIKNNQKNTLDKSIEPDCLHYKFGESTTEPNVFHFYEQYTDKAGFEHHTKQAHFAEWEVYAKSENAFVKDPVIQFWEDM
jgi:quinol monooxygenase YgiN